jgi:hypothetical protein
MNKHRKAWVNKHLRTPEEQAIVRERALKAVETRRKRKAEFEALKEKLRKGLA